MLVENESGARVRFGAWLSERARFVEFEEVGCLGTAINHNTRYFHLVFYDFLANSEAKFLTVVRAAAEEDLGCGYISLKF